MIEQVKSYYESYDEDSRLERDNSHKIEFLTTVNYFEKAFPPNSKILDTCAGTGKYALYLAQNGHRVTALDLVERNIEIIKSKPHSSRLEEIRTCNLLELSGIEDNSFDVVLCMGALYHLKTNDERLKAIAQCTRVCKNGGIIVLAYINRLGGIVSNMHDGLENIDELLTVLNGTDDWLFTTTTPRDIEVLADKSGLDMIYNIGVDGLSYTLADKINSANDENFNRYMEYHLRTCEDKSIIGISAHGLYIGRKT